MLVLGLASFTIGLRAGPAVDVAEVPDVEGNIGSGLLVVRGWLFLTRACRSRMAAVGQFFGIYLDVTKRKREQIYLSHSNPDHQDSFSVGKINLPFRVLAHRLQETNLLRL